MYKFRRTVGILACLLPPCYAKIQKIKCGSGSGDSSTTPLMENITAESGSEDTPRTPEEVVGGASTSYL